MNRKKDFVNLCPSRCGPCLCSTVEMFSVLLLKGGSHNRSSTGIGEQDIQWNFRPEMNVSSVFLSLFLFSLVLVFSSGLLQICSERSALRLNVWQFDTRRHLYFVVANCSFRAFLKVVQCPPAVALLLFKDEFVSGGHILVNPLLLIIKEHVKRVYSVNVWFP